MRCGLPLRRPRETWAATISREIRCDRVLQLLHEHLAQNLGPVGGDRPERLRASVMADIGKRRTRAALPAFISCTARSNSSAMLRLASRHRSSFSVIFDANPPLQISVPGPKLDLQLPEPEVVIGKQSLKDRPVLLLLIQFWGPIRPRVDAIRTNTREGQLRSSLQVSEYWVDRRLRRADPQLQT